MLRIRRLPLREEKSVEFSDRFAHFSATLQEFGTVSVGVGTRFISGLKVSGWTPRPMLEIGFWNQAIRGVYSPQICPFWIQTNFINHIIMILKHTTQNIQINC